MHALGEKLIKLSIKLSHMTYAMKLELCCSLTYSSYTYTLLALHKSSGNKAFMCSLLQHYHKYMFIHWTTLLKLIMIPQVLPSPVWPMEYHLIFGKEKMTTFHLMQWGLIVVVLHYVMSYHPTVAIITVWLKMNMGGLIPTMPFLLLKVRLQNTYILYENL